MPSNDPLLDKQLGNYRIIRSLGMGGMGKVYFAQDETLKRPVALKVIHEQYRQREDYRARLLAEASAIANLKHPNIVQIYTAGEHGDILFFAMEMISGRNLKDLMTEAAAEGEPIDYDAVILIGDGLAAALDYAHSKGVIHRDVKPANVLITTEPHVYLTDFGLALDIRETLRDALHESDNGSDEGGTAQYMSPEQIDPDMEIGPASDQYSFGIMLYEMLTGTVPFEGEPQDILNQHLYDPPPRPRSQNPKLTPAVEAVLLRALEKHPGDRFESCTALMHRLARALEAAKEASLPRMALPAMPAGTGARRGPLGDHTPSERGGRSAERTVPRSASKNGEKTRPYDRTLPAHLPPKGRDDRLFWASVGAIGSVLIVLALIVSIGIWMNMNAASPPPMPTMTRQPSTSTSTTIPTQTAQQVSSISTTTATPTLPSPSPLPPTTATPTPVTGDPFLLIYDDTSFNLLNLSEEPRNVTVLEFERLDFSGNPLESFSGQQWARFNDTLRPQTCMRIEISDIPFNTTPDECSNIFDAIRTTSLESISDFWTSRPGSSEFRVIWAGGEVKRCSILAHRCEIYLP